MPKNNSTNNSIIKITDGDLRDKIYTIRGVPVMLDYDLAEYYGYTTKAFNQQVSRNREKFEGEDFMFQLTWDEIDNLSMHAYRVSNNTGISRSQFVTLNKKDFSARGHNLKYRPYAFTESGIYMLMTVLKGDLATEHSRALIRTFRAMKDYILENQNLLSYRENLQIISEVYNNSKDIVKIKTEIGRMDAEVKEINSNMADVVKKSELSPIFLDFTKINEHPEILILNGKLTYAKNTIADIYNKAKKNIYIIDNYISIRTLHLLQNTKKNLEIIFFTDNTGNHLHKTDYEDFKKERLDLKIKFIKTNNLIHDRFIVLDNTDFYECGTSSKDAGNKITTIHKLVSPLIIKSLKEVVEELKNNEELKLK